MTRCRSLLLAILLGLPTASATAQPSADVEFKARFLKLCDLACRQLNDPGRQTPKPTPFYIDSYAVRSLCVAYDMTGSEPYLQACRDWSNHMIDYQARMTPKGAYYMNYNRRPGEAEGGWYVAGSSSIAMGILATSVRCRGADKKKYLDSVKSFAALVARNYIGEAGGIMNGEWPRYCGEWWCSSGIFGSLAFVLAEETDDPAYREIGRGAVNWLNHLDLTRVKFDFWKNSAPSVVMYVLEAYSAGIPSVEQDADPRREAIVQISRQLDWMSDNQVSRGAPDRWDYNSQWGSKLGGLPFHMYVLSEFVPDKQKVRDAADAELRHVSSVLAKESPPRLSQLACFAMMSYAQRLSPGSVYRKSR